MGRTCCVSLAACTVLIFGLSAVWAEEQTLARLSFWVQRERMAAFEAAYEEGIAPLLKRHGLAESSVRGGRPRIVCSAGCSNWDRLLTWRRRGKLSMGIQR